MNVPVLTNMTQSLRVLGAEQLNGRAADRKRAGVLSLLFDCSPARLLCGGRPLPGVRT